MAPHQILHFTQRVASTIAARTQTAAASSKDRGGVMAEYGLLIASVFILAIASVAIFGGAVLDLFTDANERYPNGGASTSD